MQQGFGSYTPAFFLVLVFIFFKERFEQFPLFKPQQSFKNGCIVRKEFFCFFGLIVIFWIIEHGSAHAVLSFFAHEDLIVDTAFTAGPESFVLREFGVSYGFIAEITVNFHDSETGCEPEYFCFRIFFPGEVEDLMFDGFCHPAFAELWGNDQAAVGNIFAMAPCFNIAKTNPFAFIGYGNYSFSFINFQGDIVGTSFRNACTPGFCRRFHFIHDDGREFFIVLGRNPDNDMLIVQF